MYYIRYYTYIIIYLSSPRWLQKGLLPILKNTKNIRKKIQPKNTKSELQGLENTSGWFCIVFAICFLISTVNTGLALWLIFEFVFSLYFVFLKFWVRSFFVFCIFEIVDSYFFVLCIFEQLHSYLFVFFRIFELYLLLPL